MADDDLTVTMLSLLDGLSGVKVEKKTKRLAFTVRNKVFAFRKGEGMVLKLPEAKIEDLIKKKKAVFLVMGKKQMKEWALLERRKPSDYRADLPLFKESMGFVAED